MATECYAMVRGSSIRVTGLGSRGSVPDPIRYAVSKSIAKVTINEVTESGSDEMLGSDENDNDNRVHLDRPVEMLHYTVDIDFLRVDPAVLNLVTGVLLVHRGFSGFDTLGYGEGPFDGGGSSGLLTVTGFDSTTRLPPVSFALEVWSRLAGAACASGGEVGFGEGEYGLGVGFGGSASPERRYGYTVFPHLKGGHLTSFKFDGGLVSFNIRGAQTRREPRWAVGPYDLEGPYERLVSVVSRNTLFRQMLTVSPPPAEVCGMQETTDVVEGGTATVTSDDIIDGGTAAYTSPWIIDGGRAA